MALVPRDQSPIVLQPCKEALHLPSVLVSAEWPTVLGLGPSAVPLVGNDEFDSTLFPQSRIQRVAVVGAVADQAVGCVPEKEVVDGLFREGDFMWRSTCNPGGDRKTSAVCNGHDLGPLATLRFSDGRAPFLAPAKVPSMKASVRSIPPR